MEKKATSVVCGVFAMLIVGAGVYFHQSRQIESSEGMDKQVYENETQEFISWYYQYNTLANKALLSKDADVVIEIQSLKDPHLCSYKKNTLYAAVCSQLKNMKMGLLLDSKVNVGPEDLRKMDVNQEKLIQHISANFQTNPQALIVPTDDGARKVYYNQIIAGSD